MSECQLCSKSFFAREDKVRFCSDYCRIEWFAIERRVAVQFLRAEPDYEEIMKKAIK